MTELTRIQKFIVAYFLLIACFAAGARAQSKDSILPGPQPPDVSKSWKEIVGIYGTDNSKQTFILLERDGKLFWQDDTVKDGVFNVVKETPFPAPQGNKLATQPFQRDSNGGITGLVFENTNYKRTDPGTNSSHSYHVAPVRSVAELRAEALAATPPAEQGPFEKSDLVELAKLDPAIHLDIRYATTNDFLRTPVYTQARAFMQRPAAESLVRALQKLKALGYGLLIHDAYRPWYVTKIFWDATPPEGKIFVADPSQGSRHNRGCAVDLTLYDLTTGKPIEMPGTYDEMSPRSFPNFPGGTSLQRWHRELLRHAMESENFTVYEFEWWHFDYKDWRKFAIQNTPFEKLGAAH